MAAKKTSKLDSLRDLPTGMARQMAPAAAPRGHRVRRDEAGAPVLLRLHGALLGRLDRALKGETRQEAIRRVLEEHLPA